MPLATLLVMSNPVEAREAEYNDWYTHQHLVDVLRVPGVVSAERFRMAAGLTEVRWRYFALYNIDHEQPEEVLTEMANRAGSEQMPMSDAMADDWTAVLYESIAKLSRTDLKVEKIA